MSTYFEDIEIGAVRELGSYQFTRAAIVDFASRYDPQPFHLDEEAGRQSMFGAMSASGWHTIAVWLRLLIDERNRIGDHMRYRGEQPARYGPSPGFEKLRWVKPVLVGDTIRFTTCAIDKRVSKSRPEVGLVTSQNQGLDAQGDLVFSLVSKIFVERAESRATTDQ